ncbi:MAG: tRNA (N(6)-L-threonylcarbamoyladenosine(37)-C(2))-methylthiotransferase [Candidatus Micrarchaeota archaeon]|nr:tRNA (N(6)-L-threonylcarbamoyladenosine(37)-C(2))-methylthiotransferase [Candidatus Micrarchaeota archaeon]MDE1847370.1 tRNA (N(6)-L-threonylcarbamoyladenosine(37)-C(2))-methylthiotransferase [Candidatus Micrarchaeota archaeon]MDE1863985.1 tRNA (N(6)-L-threonylcarbamoyladenosine(37)-C(2))-methylthiotransferase [Candidatus Micrarchaeota archaeon]
MAKKVLIETYGCTLNQADSSTMGAMLKAQGYQVEYGKYEGHGKYDYVVMNTCTVKSSTETKILHRVGRLKGLGSRLIVAGCMASANQDRIESVTKDASIVTTSNTHNIASAIAEIEAGKRAVYNHYERKDKLAYPLDNKSVIAKIPISEGCLSNCGFCETKYARGPLNSFSQELILKQVQIALRNGAREIELTSQDTGAYGLDRGTNIAELLEEASKFDGFYKIRVGMLNPEHLPKYFARLIDACKSEKVYKFLHLPLQSGSNKILRAMKRNYTIESFNEYVRRAREEIPGITIATDIIVGFPGETEEDFQETMNFIRTTKPEITNVSKFAIREHAPAARLKQLPNRVLKERAVGASRAYRKVQEEYREKLIGKELSILLTENKSKSMNGRDEFYNEVAITSSNEKIGSLLTVRVENFSGGGLIAKPF